MSQENETNPDEEGQRAIEVEYLLSVPEVPRSSIVRAVEATFAGHPTGNVSVAVIDDHTIGHLNQRYKNKAEPTDVLAFDLRDQTDGPLEGEIVVSADTARQRSNELGVDFAEELLRYVIHGALHLMGYTDETDQKRDKMHQEEDRVLARLQDHSGNKERNNKGV